MSAARRLQLELSESRNFNSSMIFLRPFFAPKRSSHRRQTDFHSRINFTITLCGIMLQGCRKIASQFRNFHRTVIKIGKPPLRPCDVTAQPAESGGKARRCDLGQVRAQRGRNGNRLTRAGRPRIAHPRPIQPHQAQTSRARFRLPPRAVAGALWRRPARGH